MKLAKKILVAMLALALLASTFLFGATATDTYNAPGIDDVEDILEYYTLEDYLADNYDDGTWTTSLFTKGSKAVVEAAKDPTNEENGVLKATLPYNQKAGYTKETKSTEKLTGLTDKLFLTFKIYFDESADGNLLFELKVGTVNEKNQATSSQFTILQFNFKGTAGIYSSAWNPDSQSFGSTTSPIQNVDAETGEAVNVSPETGKWYDVVISVNAAEDFYYFDITELDGTVVASSGVLPLEGAKAIWGFNCYGQHSNISNRSAQASFYVDDMEIYEGSFVRYPSRKDDITTTHLQDLKALYNAPTTDFATQERIVDVLSYLYNEAENFTVGSVLPEAYQYINETYAKAYDIAAAAINTSASYDERVAYLDVLARYDAKLPAAAELNGAAGITADLEAKVVAARAAYATEVETLNTIKAQSDAFIEFIANYDATNKTYAYVLAQYAEASEDKFAKRDVTYAGVAAANEIYESLKFKATRMAKDVEVFMNAVDEMEAATTFGPLFAAYTVANASYTKYDVDAVINPDLDPATVEGLEADIASYESKVEDILARAYICDEFNRIIKEATIASYYTSLVTEIEEAKVVRPQFGDYEMDYPGIAESVTTYEAFLVALTGTKNAVEAYISAVNAIASATTFDAKKAAINAALKLKAEGDVLGAEGVVEANIALTAAEAEINFLEGSSTTLISLVEQIKAAKTLAEKRDLIHLANVSAANAEDTYTGVSAAKADLAAEITAFEAAVAAANAALDSALKSAQAVVYCVD